MKAGMRFVDCDMHVMEPASLFAEYLEPTYRERVTFRVTRDGNPGHIAALDGVGVSSDLEMQQYRKPGAPRSGQAARAGMGVPGGGVSRLQSTNRMDFAIERNYNAEAQVMAMELEDIDIAVLFPTVGLSLIGRHDLDPRLSLAVCRAYNNWVYDFCQYSPDQLRWVAMLPFQDVNLACEELVRCVKRGAVGSFMRPNLVGTH